jgi:5-(aminomethyl)-3-furanmethanol phosphate kinase
MSATMDRRPLRIVKVGGSLLDWPDLPMTLGQWLAAQPPADNVLLAGGGALADVIRQADATHRLGEPTAHQLCVELLGVTARLLHSLLADRAALTTFAELLETRRAHRLPRCLVLDPCEFLTHQEPAAAGNPLPHTWDVTSDSIAARIAEVLAADELVLLKSREPPQDSSLAALAADDYVDRYFPVAASGFRGKVRMVNLRAFSKA